MVYFCPACTSIQSDTLQLSPFPVSAVVALDHLRRLLLLMVTVLSSTGRGSFGLGRRKSGSSLRHDSKNYSEA